MIVQLEAKRDEDGELDRSRNREQEQERYSAHGSAEHERDRTDEHGVDRSRPVGVSDHVSNMAGGSVGRNG